MRSRIGFETSSNGSPTAETFARYEAALDQLSEPEREAVIARLELGCSYQEVAQLLGKPSEDAARMTVTRAVDKVATLMSSQD
jgi:DNA-directed RNA polymerase specialized sigma24 family protein